MLKSKQIKNTNKTFSEFFGNSAMARLLDVFLDNPSTEMNTLDLLKVSSLSRKAMYVQMPLLIEKDIVSEDWKNKFKVFKLNKDSEQVKQISKFRDILYRGKR